jgi:hypothetical protein
MAKTKGTAGRAGTTEALTPSAGRNVTPTLITIAPAPGTEAPTVGKRPAAQSIYLGAVVGPEGQARFRRITEFDRSIKVGMPVRVRWGYGLSFRAEGVGEIVKVFRGSVQVKLTNPVPSPRGGQPWPAGFVLKGIPRFMGNNWNFWNSVEPR